VIEKMTPLVVFADTTRLGIGFMSCDLGKLFTETGSYGAWFRENFVPEHDGLVRRLVGTLAGQPSSKPPELIGVCPRVTGSDLLLPRTFSLTGDKLAQLGIELCNYWIMGVKLSTPVSFLGDVDGFSRLARNEIITIPCRDVVLSCL
jgi:hypothetical protein